MMKTPENTSNCTTVYQKLNFFRKMFPVSVEQVNLTAACV